MQLRHRGLKGGHARLALLADTLADLDGVERCRVRPWSRQITIDFRPESPMSGQLLDRVERVRESLEPIVLAGPHRGGHPFGASADEPVVVLTGMKRLFYLGMAGGSFAAALFALAVPGLPTVPCLLATSYYLARSSPALDLRLRHAPFFGPVLEEWEHSGALSTLSKEKLAGLTVVVVVVTIILAPLTPVSLAVILLLSSASIYGITRMPALPAERADSPLLNGHPRLLLAAP